jgi:Family of unknown function (DUF6580)
MLAYVFVVLAIAVRFMPHPWMFTPVTASLLFFGARGPRRFLWAPVVMLAASDVVLTKWFWHYRFTWDQLVVWAWYAAVLMLGTRLRENRKPLWIMASALGSSVAFYLLSNFAVWASFNMYPKTLAGLMTCYTLAIPFFKPSLIGDLLFTAGMFAMPVLMSSFAEKASSGPPAAA